MADYEQLLHCLRAMGVPYTERTHTERSWPHDTVTYALRAIEVGTVAFRCDTDGQFRGLSYEVDGFGEWESREGNAEAAI